MFRRYLIRKIKNWYASLGKSTVPMLMFIACVSIFFLYPPTEKYLIIYFDKLILGNFYLLVTLSMGAFLGLIWIIGDDDNSIVHIHGAYRIISGWTLFLPSLIIIIMLMIKMISE